MPRYYFHSEDGERVVDNDGVELDDDQSARAEAVRFAGAVLADNPDEVWHSGHWRVEVADEKNELLFTLIAIAVDAPKLADPR